MDLRTLTAMLASAACFWVSARPLPAQTPRNPELRQELLSHLAADQAIRDTLVHLMQRSRTPDSAFAMRMMSIDVANTRWLKGIIAQHGWPGRTLVGEDGAQAAFLIVQHATHDTAFMAATLPLLERAVAAGEASAGSYAMLFDRVAVKARRPQRFGTQASLVDGRMVFDPIEDSARVDARRASVGLPPLRDYKQVLDSLYTARRSP